MSDIVHVIKAQIDPNSAPTRSGQHWINEVTKQTWLSVGISSINDWILVGNSNDWLLSGNTGTDPNVNFIGTKDSAGLSFKTDDVQRIRIDEQGRVQFGQENPQGFIHIKEHTTSPGTGRIIHTFEVLTNDLAYSLAYAYTVPDGAVVKIRAHILGRRSNSSRCSFERVNTYTRDGGSAIRVDQGQSTYTYRSHAGYDFRFSQAGNQATLEVKADSAATTKWIGTVEIDVLIS